MAKLCQILTIEQPAVEEALLSASSLALFSSSFFVSYAVPNATGVESTMITMMCNMTRKSLRRRQLLLSFIMTTLTNNQPILLPLLIHLPQDKFTKPLYNLKLNTSPAK